jgi:hypothetical protein
MTNPERTFPASSVRDFIALGLLSALLIGLKVFFIGASTVIWDYLLPNVTFYGLMGIAIYRSKALTVPRIVLFAVAMILVSGLLYELNYRVLMPQLSAHHIKPQIIGDIFGRLVWFDGAVTALATLAVFRGRSPIALVAAIMPGTLAAGLFSFAMIAPQIVGFGMPDMKALQVISILASQTIYAVALWVVVTNNNQPIAPGFMSVTLKRPPDLHWIFVVILTLFSGGGFANLWCIVQACWAKGVDRSTTALRSCLGAVAIFVIVFALITLLPFLPPGGPRSAVLLLAILLLVLAVVAYVVGAFAIATAIETYAQAVHSRDLRLNRFWVFLIAVPYLQFHLSRLAADEPEYHPISAVFA